MYRVDWLQTALDQLMDIWINADSTLRRTITAATHQADQILKDDPYGASESRPHGRRVLFATPLGVLFRVDPN